MTFAVLLYNKASEMAVCVAVLDKTSTPLKLLTNDPSRELAFHYVVHASLDVSRDFWVSTIGLGA